MTATKIRIKTLGLELDYEGSEEFFKKELLKLLDVAGSSPGGRKASTPAEPLILPSDGSRSTRSIAAALDVKTGSDLVLAAAAQLVLFRGSESMRRQALLDEMKTATGYYKSTVSNNFSKYLGTLVRDGKLIELSPEVYTLSAGVRVELERKLA
jgi:hypothetical protein